MLSTYRDLLASACPRCASSRSTARASVPTWRSRSSLPRSRAASRSTLFGDGNSRRDYTFIDDIVTGTVAAIERIAPAQYEIYNLGGTCTISLIELVRTIERVVGKSAAIDWQPDQPGDVPLTFANVDRARAALGYAPTTTPEVGIARYWQWLDR